MRTGTKIVAFVVVLAAVFVAALGLGRVVGPVGQQPVASAHDTPGHGADDDMGADPPAEIDPARIPGGLMVSQNGFTFDLAETTVPPGEAAPVSFTIDGPDGDPVTDYVVAHDKRLHLIAVRRDFTGFQHVHPVMDAGGVWTAAVDLTAGQWRLFADFNATGADPLTLGADLAVTGPPAPTAVADDARVATVDDYTVTLTGDLVPGTEAELGLRVARDGEPVTDLEPYLGSYGHLVALRAGDLAYLHVHPEGAPVDGQTEPGPDVVFFAEVPSVGTYHLYLDFKHRGVVRTAAFTVDTSEEQQ